MLTFFPAILIRLSFSLTVDFLCEAAGDPCHYFGLDIKTAHQGLGITEQLWTVNMGYLGEVLDQLKVAQREKKEFLNLVTVYKDSVVER